MKPREKSVAGVYFVLGLDLVKIGYVGSSYSWGMDKRLRGLESCSPAPLTLHRFVPAGRFSRHVEGCLHRQFAEHHHHDEWFTAAPVLAWLEEHDDAALLRGFIEPRHLVTALDHSLVQCSATTCNGDLGNAL